MNPLLRIGMAAALSALACVLPAQAQWKPTQHVNYMIGVAPGGTVDLYARGIKNGLDTLNLVNGQTVLAENRPGAGGTLAMQVLQRANGNGHYLATFHTGSIAGAITGILKVDPRDYPPVAMLVEETTVVAVPNDSPIKSGRDLIATLKKDPGSLRIAVAPALGQNIHLAIAKPLKVAGVDVRKLTIAPFRSSADSVAALLGGHVDVVSATAPVVLPQVEAGKVRIIASAAREHGVGPLANVLTWHEQGVNADYVSYNGVMLAPGTSPDQLRFWEDALRTLSQSKEWITLVEKSGNRPIFRGHADSMRYLQTEWQSTLDLANELGLAAK